MSKEFGIYPENCVVHYWIGCRAIITERRLDIPWDRWSNQFISTARKNELIGFVNLEAIPELERRIKKGDTKGWFDSKDGKFRCEYDDKNSGGYMYCGFYNLTIEEED